MCDCMETVDKMLADHNTRLVRAISFGPSRERVMIETEVLTKKRGAKAVGMFPSYCPFCGVSLSEEVA